MPARIYYPEGYIIQNLILYWIRDENSTDNLFQKAQNAAKELIIGIFMKIEGILDWNCDKQQQHADDHRRKCDSAPKIIAL